MKIVVVGGNAGTTIGVDVQSKLVTTDSGRVRSVQVWLMDEQAAAQADYYLGADAAIVGDVASKAWITIIRNQFGIPWVEAQNGRDLYDIYVGIAEQHELPMPKRRGWRCC